MIVDGHGAKSPGELALRRHPWRPLYVGAQNRIPVGRPAALVADHTEQIFAGDAYLDDAAVISGAAGDGKELGRY